MMFKLIIDNKVAMWVKEVIELEKEEAVEEP
jgi:hypothetical protein